MGDLIANIVIIGSISILTPLVLALLYRLKAREERKSRPNGNRTRLPKFLTITLLVCAILFFVLLIVCAIGAAVDGEFEIMAAVLIGAVLIAVLFSVLYLFVCRHYEIIEEDRLILVRAFGKKRKPYAYRDIAYFSFVPGYMNGLIAYNVWGIQLFQISAFTIGLDTVVTKLREAGVTQVSLPFPTPNMKRVPTYVAYRKRRNRLALIVGIAKKPPIFENSRVEGSLESYRLQNDTLTLKLTDDRAEYYVGSLIFEALDLTFERYLSDGEPLTLTVGYTDDKGRKVLSQIELRGKPYLRADDAERALWNDYRLGLGTGYCSVGLAALCFLPAVILTVRYKRGKPEPPLLDVPAAPTDELH